MKKSRYTDLSVVLFTLLLSCIFFAACSKGNEDNPEQPENIIEDFEQGNMNFTEGAGEQTFSFTANTAWTVSVASTRNGGSPWCTVAPTSGNAGSHTIKVTTTPNETYDDRSVTVTLKAGTEVRSFVVSQKQKDALLLTNNKFEVDQKGGTVTVEVKANVSYTATIGEECKDWIKESGNTRALATTTKSYDIAMNESQEKREGSIIFSDGSLTETVHIYQAGGSIILLSRNDCHVSASGEEITVELRSNCDYEVVMPSVDWIKEPMTRGMSSHTLHYTVAPNDSYDGRKVEIIYRDKSDSSIADTLTVMQAQKDAIIISEKEVKVGSEGGIVEVKIDANVDFEMQLPDMDWISETVTRGLSTHKKYLRIAENMGESSREARILFRNTTSGIEETLTVSQSAKGKRVKVHVEKPGMLSTLISEEDKTRIEELEISGNLGGLDIAFIREMAGRDRINGLVKGKLAYLDMSESHITADGEYYLYTKHEDKYYYPSDDKISERMFEMCYLLQTVILPTSVTSIEYQAFNYCENLVEVIIPNSVTTIGAAAFKDCISLTDIVIPNSVVSFGSGVFAACTNLSSITWSKGMTSTGLYTFIDCSSLANVIIPDNIKHIDEGAFYGCTQLSNIVIPHGVTEIGNQAFYECHALADITIPNSVTEIGYQSFKGCLRLSQIVIPNSVVTLGEKAFEGCSNLIDITLGSEIGWIGEGTFYGVPITKMYCYAVKPPYIIPYVDLPQFSLDLMTSTSILYVPKGTLRAYEDSNWNSIFRNIVEMEK